MRFRVSAAVLTGALAATALAVPAAAHADDKSAFRADLKKYAAQGKARDVAQGDTRILSASINGGKPIVLGTHGEKKVDIVITAKDNKGIARGYAQLWRGTDFDNPQGIFFTDQEDVACSNKGTTGTCKLTMTLDPELEYNTAAGGGWKLLVAALSKDNTAAAKYAVTTTSIQRDSRLTVDAAPEPVTKNTNLTVTGALTRANWDTGTYTGYSAQPVKLQYRAKDAKTYTTVKTVTTDNVGKLKTTVKATADGYYRYSFAGTSTTKPVTTAGDYIDVN